MVHEEIAFRFSTGTSTFDFIFHWLYYNTKGLKGRNTSAQVEGLREGMWSM